MLIFGQSVRRIILDKFSIVVIAQIGGFSSSYSKIQSQLNICNKYFCSSNNIFPRSDLRVGFHHWRTSFVILCPSIPDIGQMAPASLLVPAGLVILRVHSESSCPSGWQMPSSDALSSW